MVFGVGRRLVVEELFDFSLQRLLSAKRLSRFQYLLDLGQARRLGGTMGRR